MCKSLFWHKSSSLDVYTMRELPHQMVVLFFVLLRNCHTICYDGHVNLHDPPAVYKVCFSPHPHQHFYLFLVLYDGQTTEMDLICMSLIVTEIAFCMVCRSFPHHFDICLLSLWPILKLKLLLLGSCFSLLVFSCHICQAQHL